MRPVYEGVGSGHSWAGWEPKGPARRFTGEEMTLHVLGSLSDDGGSWLGIALRKEGEDLVEFVHIDLPADTLEDPYLAHVTEDGSRRHVLHWDDQGAHCSEPMCDVNWGKRPR